MLKKKPEKPSKLEWKDNASEYAFEFNLRNLKQIKKNLLINDFKEFEHDDQRVSFDPSTKYKEWMDGSRYYEGQRSVASKKPHGLCWLISANGDIELTHFKSGSKHGLRICLSGGKSVLIEHCKDGQIGDSFCKRDTKTNKADKKEGAVCEELSELFRE